jgi:hypothetical protein
MKEKSKLYSWISAVVAVFFLTVSSNHVYGASDIDFGPTGSEASISNPDGTWINMWGPAFVSTIFDTTNPPPSGDTTGSIYNEGNWTGDTSGMDDYNMISPGTWYGDVVFNGALYSSIELDIKYDVTNSTMTPTSAAHLNIGFDTGYAFVQITNESFDTAASPLADGKWHHLSIPISASQSGIGSADGVAYYQWNPAGTSGTMNYWLANVQLIARLVPVAPPSLIPLTKAEHGLNIIASTEGNSFYDRQSVLCTTNHGVSWVGQATTANPVTYSFTISGFPTAAANQYSMESYMFLVPNPTANDNAPDYNETNCIIAELQSTPAGSQLLLQYKVNEPDENSMQYDNAPYTNAVGSWNGVTTPWYENGALGSLQSTLLDGTYSLKFTSSSNITLITPDGSTTNLVIPPYYAGNFAENTSFNVYLGMQANNAASINEAVAYGDFTITGNLNPVSDDFLTDTTLNTNLWNTAVATNPKGIIVVPSSAAYWANWTLPASGYSLLAGSNLLNMASWTSPSIYPVIATLGYNSQLIDTSELPAGNAGFFECLQRTFTQLQVLLPGEANAPGTTTGKTGTPTPVSLGAGGLENVTVNAVDATFHIINGVTDTIHLTSTDGGPNGGVTPINVAMVNGTASFTGQSGYAFGDEGTFTITATDETTTTIAPATSSSVTVGP